MRRSVSRGLLSNAPRPHRSPTHLTVHGILQLNNKVKKRWTNSSILRLLIRFFDCFIIWSVLWVGRLPIAYSYHENLYQFFCTVYFVLVLNKELLVVVVVSFNWHVVRGDIIQYRLISPFSSSYLIQNSLHVQAIRFSCEND